ncbi:hypothetical protein NX059_008244 [Plenodomus lindquistii]|nr:hypothetical protein NX059_008244 [Plenodomus lindquistii]
MFSRSWRLACQSPPTFHYASKHRPTSTYAYCRVYSCSTNTWALSSQHNGHWRFSLLSTRLRHHNPTAWAYRNNLPPSHISRPRRTMSSDAEYASFLDKANQDTGSAEAKGASKKSYSTDSVNTGVPKALEQVDEVYTSDADEAFEPVALKFDGSSVSAGEEMAYESPGRSMLIDTDDLKSLLGGEKKVEEVKQKLFESQYKSVMDAVKKAGDGQVKVFRVELSETRAEYYVVSVDSDQGRLVGLKALSVES